MFLDRLQDKQLYCIAGNHDCYYRNTNEINGLEEFLAPYNAKIITNEPYSLEIENTEFHFVPWINSQNYEQMVDYIRNASGVLLAHLECDGFAMYKGSISQSGMKREIFSNLDIVFTGHYHHRSKKANIQYIGAPYEMCWSDAYDDRGFCIYDTITNTYEFVNNPNRVYHKIDWDKKLLKEDLSYLENCYVKLVVDEEFTQKEISKAVQTIESFGVAECVVINLSAFKESSQETGDTIAIADTLQLFDEFIIKCLTEEEIRSKTNNLLSKKDLSKTLKDIYQEALIEKHEL